MSCCINPDCPKPANQDNSKFCQTCGHPIPTLLINRFKVLKVIGQGGFGRTYLALDQQKLDEQCVLKQLIYPAREGYLMGQAESMFYKEAKQLQTLGNHAQIPALYAFFTHESNQFLVQEWIEGNTLEQELYQGYFSETKIRQVLNDLLPVLEFIHQQNVIHRDIKPGNIMRNHQTGKLMLIDFGISKTFCIDTLTKTGTIVGSHGYSSREQIMEGKTTPATDLFSLGVSCFHLMTRVPPLDLSVNYGFSWIGQWQSHLPHKITPEFEVLMGRLMAVDVRDRYSSAQEVLKDLTQLPEAPTEFLASASATHPYRQTHTANTTPIDKDPFLTEPIPSARVPSSAPTTTPLKPNGATFPRRKVLKYLGIGIGGAGAIALWNRLSNPDLTTSNTIVTPDLKGRTKAVRQFRTIAVDRSGQTQSPKPISIELIREDLGNNIFLDLVTVPANSFLMGSPTSEAWRDEDESPQHLVKLRSFLMGVYEVSQEQWQAVSQMPKVEIDMRVDDSTFKGANRPVERVTWFEAVEFCKRLSRQTGHQYRLPSEAEWEYACRAGSTVEFSFGRTLTSTVANFDTSNTYADEKPGEFRKRTTDVGAFYANDWGLHDMHGNVMEWCADHWHENYTNAPSDGSTWITNGDKKLRVLRGGSWFDPPRINRSANRSKKKPSVRHGDVGLRVACELPV